MMMMIKYFWKNNRDLVTEELVDIIERTLVPER
jgi:hypothetical protein